MKLSLFNVILLHTCSIWKERRPLHAVGLVGALVGALIISSCVSVPAPKFVDRCAALNGKKLASGIITGTKLLPASATQPETCSVSGQIVSSPTSTINFQIDMPAAASWNKKLIHVGGAGFNGQLRTAENVFPLFQGNNVRKRGYVIVGSDSGHQTKGMTEGSWALDNPSALDNFAFASIPAVLESAIAATELLYGSRPILKYFYGWSTGGREALQQAQSNPGNYNGIIAMEPLYDYNAFALKNLAIQKMIFANKAAGWMSPAKIKVLSDAQLAACDKLDGLADGIISNVSACAFDVRSIRCSDGTDQGDSCLSDAQIASLQVIRSNTELPVPLVNDIHTAYGFGIGGEADNAMGLTNAHYGPKPQPGSLGIAIAAGWAINVMASDPKLNIFAYDPRDDAQRIYYLSEKVTAANADLSAFADRGGKMILWHGSCDFVTQPQGSVEYYKRVSQVMSQKDIGNFFTFYTSPGVTHLGTGPGAGIVDLLSVLENWTEKNVAPPDSITATKFGPDRKPAFTRPICQYPNWPKYNGTGDVNQASSFTCVR